MVRAVLAALAAVFLALPASAQQLSLEIHDGLVTLQATNVSARQVLAEWARVGGTRVVGADRVSGPPLTLTLQGVPEAKALDIVLRGAAGYMAAARAVPGSGSSGYDRILVLASSTAPAGGAAPTTAGRTPATRAFGVPPAVEPPPDAADVAMDSPEPTPDSMPQGNPFANAFGQPGLAQPFGQPGMAQPFGQAQPNPFGQPIPNPFQALQPQAGQGGLFTPVQPQPMPAAPGTFFGVGGTSTPGVVQLPVQPQQPGVRPRPQQ